MPTSDSQYQLGFVNYIKLENPAEQITPTSGVFGSTVCLVDLLDVQSPSVFGATVCIPETLDLQSTSVFGATVCLTNTLDLASPSVYGSTISITTSGLCYPPSALTERGNGRSFLAERGLAGRTTGRCG